MKDLQIYRQLDTHLTPIKVGDFTTPIEISSSDLRITKKATFDNDLQVNGLLEIGGTSSKIDMVGGVTAEANSQHGVFSVIAQALFVNSVQWEGDGDTSDNTSTLALLSSDGYDAKIILYESANPRWTLGFDADDSDAFKIDVGTATVGGDTQFSLDSSGNATIEGTLTVKGDTIATDGNMLLDTPDNNNVSIDANTTATTNGTYRGLYVDLDHTGVSALGQHVYNIGIDTTVNSNASHVGENTNRGFSATLSGTTSGTTTGSCFYGTITGHDDNIGLYLNTQNVSGTGIKLVSSADTGDFSTINTSANGATTIQTVDDDGDNAFFKLDIDGAITLDSHNGEFIAKKAGTEFSVANSAYAGMILGYQMIGESASHDTYTFTTSFAVPDSDMNVKFVAPPSGNVEITVQFFIDGDNANYNYIGLSDNATYNSVGNTYEQIFNYTDETDQNTIQHSWVVTGLTAGTAYQYWMGLKSSTAHGSIKWGGTGTNRNPDFIMKAVALPAATSEFAVYD